MKDSKMTKRWTGGWVVACVALAAAVAFTAVFAQEASEQEKETLPDGGAVKPGEMIGISPIPYPPPTPRKPSYIAIPRVADTEVILLHVLAETDMELHEGSFRSAKGEAKAEEAAREVMSVLKHHGAGRVERAEYSERFGTRRVYRVDVKGLPEKERFECLKALHGSRAAWKAKFVSLSENLPRKPEQLSWGRVEYDEEARHTDLIQVKFREGSKVRLQEGKLVTLSESEEEGRRWRRSARLLRHTG